MPSSSGNVLPEPGAGRVVAVVAEPWDWKPCSASEPGAEACHLLVPEENCLCGPGAGTSIDPRTAEPPICDCSFLRISTSQRTRYCKAFCLQTASRESEARVCSPSDVLPPNPLISFDEIERALPVAGTILEVALDEEDEPAELEELEVEALEEVEDVELE